MANEAEMDLYASGRNLMVQSAQRIARSVEALPSDDSCVSVLCRLAQSAALRLANTSVLVRPESIGEAAALTRTLIETLVSAAYINAPNSASERCERAARFRAFEPVERHRLHVAVLPYADQSERFKRAFAAHEGRRNASIAAFDDIEERITRGWSGIGVGGMRRTLTVADLGAPVIQKTMVADDYGWLSSFVHVTETSVRVSLGDDEVGFMLATQVPPAAVIATAFAAFHWSVRAEKEVASVTDLIDAYMAVAAAAVKVQIPQG